MTRHRKFLMKVPALMVVVALVSACATTSSPNAGDVPSATKPSAASAAMPSVDEIVAKNVAARGGKERLQALTSIRETGTVTGPGGNVANVIREIQRPGLFRLEFSFQGTTSVFAHDGARGWQVAPLQGKFEPMAMPPELDAADQRDIEGALLDWQQKGHVVTLIGREAVDGKDTFKLEIKLRGGATRYDFVDAASGHVVRSEITRLVEGRPQVLENLFSDFRTTGGLVFPHAIETRIKERPQVLRIAVQKVELNPTLDVARFQMPR